jgi:hypothetical protein
MGLATVGGGGGGSGAPVDFGALFGSGQPKVGELKWEAPATPSASTGLPLGWHISGGKLGAYDGT